MKITFLGGGNMANALIGGLVEQGLRRCEIAVIDLDAENRAKPRSELPRALLRQRRDPASMHCDALVLAVKPQQMRKPALLVKQAPETQLVISIAAGLDLTALSRWLGGHAPSCAPCPTRRP